MQPSFVLMVISVLLTAVCWGTYGPILHWGQLEMGGRLRTFICVGIAYFLVAIVVPLIFMYVSKWEMGSEFKVTTKGATWSLVGGALGAVGALGIILAFTFSPFPKPATPLVVMPLVFGLAPVVNTFFQLYMNRGKEMEPISPFFAAGLILAAVGAASVLVFAPQPVKGAKGGTHAKKEVRDADSDRAMEVAHMTGGAVASGNPMVARELADADDEEEIDGSSET